MAQVGWSDRGDNGVCETNNIIIFLYTWSGRLLMRSHFGAYRYNYVSFVIILFASDSSSLI